MAIFYTKEEKGNKVTVKYNALLPITYYFTFVVIGLLFSPLVIMFFIKTGTTYKAILEILNLVIPPVGTVAGVLWVIYILDSFLIRREVNIAMKNKGVTVKGSRYSFTNRVVLTYEK